MSQSSYLSRFLLLAHRHADLRYPTEDAGRGVVAAGGVAGGAREAAAFATAAGLAALGLMALVGCFSTPQLDKRSSQGSARDGRFVLSSLFRAWARPPTARATRPIRAGKRESGASSRVKVKLRTRALALLVLVRGSARQTAARQNARHRRIFVFNTSRPRQETAGFLSSEG